MIGWRRVVLSGAASLGLAGAACRSQPVVKGPSVELTRVPAASEGGPDRTAPIAGRGAPAPAKQSCSSRAADPGGCSRSRTSRSPRSAPTRPSTTPRTSGRSTPRSWSSRDTAPPPDRSAAGRSRVASSPWSAKGVPPTSPRAGGPSSSPATIGVCATLRASVEAGPTSTTRATPGPTIRGRCICGLLRATRGGRVLRSSSRGASATGATLRRAGCLAPPARRRPGPLHLGRRGRRPALPRAGRGDQPLGDPATPTRSTWSSPTTCRPT